MEIRIEPHSLSGEVTAIPSKSAAHRCLIAAALADRPTSLRLAGSNRDLTATLRCLANLGAQFEQTEPDVLRVTPLRQKPSVSPVALPCQESGTTLRFLLPLAAALGVAAYFSGEGRLPQRPLADLRQQMSRHGCAFSQDSLPFTLSGQLQPGEFSLPGNISSQYISGLLLALPLLPRNSRIELTTPLESAGYVDLTIAVLAQFGVRIQRLPKGYQITGGQSYHSPGRIAVEGDWSNAACWLVGGACSQTGIHVRGLNLASVQGDRAITTLLQSAGVNLSLESGRVTARREMLRAFAADTAQIPDLVPLLAVLAAAAKGESRLRQVRRLRLKESDRLQAILGMLAALGGRAFLEDDGDTLCIVGRGFLAGGLVNSYADHRMVMAAAIAACFSQNCVTIQSAQAIEKSYPDFFLDYAALGGKYDVL
ncbi:MAG: 3-phosphoshikimate 1-carboxyvinyltransferase [Negativicutes bacterium]|nr:3-phosphoshikimate 1-carboxyvinyltransferase [Negativicutes bacterium]